MGVAIRLIGVIIFTIRRITNATNGDYFDLIFIRDSFPKVLPPQYHVGATCTRPSIQGEISDLRHL